MALEKMRHELQGELDCLGKGGDAQKHMADCAKISAAATVLAWLGWALFSKEAIAGILFSLATGACAFAFTIYGPGRELDARARRIEKELPFALMQLSVELNTGFPMDRAMWRIAKGDYGELSGILLKALRTARLSGESIPKALFSAAEKEKSKQLRRCFSQLVSIYEQGTKKAPGEIVRQMALEGLSRQKAEAKEFAGKMQVLSIAFIAVSAIVPALFEAFIAIGSSFIEIAFGPAEVLLITCVAFPALDAAILLYIMGLTPESMKG